MSSQRHKRDIHGFDASGDTPFNMGDRGLPDGAFTEDVADQTYEFADYFPTGTAFALSGTPTGMSINASTGVLSGTPTTVQAASVILTVTYTSATGPRTETVDWSYAVVAA